jgi:sugar phosphate isomerase/epimerase
MQLGFVSAVLADLSLEEVLAFAADEGFRAVELMCWPPGKADRRYAGVTHVDVTALTPDAAAHVKELARIHGVAISGLGYYPNPLDPDPDHRRRVTDHLKQVIRAAGLLGVPVVNTFVGRDPTQGVSATLAAVRPVWDPIVELAASTGIKLGIEHCPMLFSPDEWPGGKNVASCPEVWRHLFDLYPGDTLGLNFDPSHLVWQFIDAGRAVREFGQRIVHAHAKDERIDRERLYRVGVLGMGWHQPKLPGLGDVNWPEVFAALTDVGYAGPVCVEMEDKGYEGSLDARKRGLRQSKRFLEQYTG